MSISASGPARRPLARRRCDRHRAAFVDGVRADRRAIRSGSELHVLERKEIVSDRAPVIGARPRLLERLQRRGRGHVAKDRRGGWSVAVGAAELAYEGLATGIARERRRLLVAARGHAGERAPIGAVRLEVLGGHGPGLRRAYLEHILAIGDPERVD